MSHLISWFVSKRPDRPGLRRLFIYAWCATGLLLGASGCATWQPPAAFNDAALRERAVTDTKQDVRVSAAVLSAEDSRRMFGADINATGVQPIWLEVRNQTTKPLWLLRPGTDPDYFSPLEIAWSMHTPLAPETNERIDDHFDRLSLKNPILPGETRAGVLFTNPERLTKLLNIDLFQGNGLIPFTLFLPVPDDADPRSRPILYAYPEAEITHCRDLDALRAALERLPCCATDAQGATHSDPLNAVLVGELPDIGAAMVRRSFRRDARATDASQHVYGRAPDAVLRKQARAGVPSMWVRAWLAPIRFDDRAVYVVQIGRPVGGRFAPRDAAGIVPHEDVDEARNLFLQDMMYSGGLEKIGFVTGVGAAPPAQPRTMSGGARYHTDGLRAALFLATRPLSLSDVEILDWVPALAIRGVAARDESVR